MPGFYGHDCSSANPNDAVGICFAPDCTPEIQNGGNDNDDDEGSDS